MNEIKDFCYCCLILIAIYVGTISIDLEFKKDKTAKPKWIINLGKWRWLFFSPSGKVSLPGLVGKISIYLQTILVIILFVLQSKGVIKIDYYLLMIFVFLFTSACIAPFYFTGWQKPNKKK